MSSSKRTITLTKADFVAIEREYCTRKLSYFAQRAWHVLEPTSPLKWGWALDAICDHLEAVTSGDINRLLINVSPGSMKSLLTSVLWPAWEWGAKDKASRRYLSTSHKQDLATRDNVKCRRLIQSSWYQSMWPVQIVGDQNQRQKFENSSTGFRESMAFGSMTGSRGDCVIIDDAHSVDDANSRTKLASDVTTFREALPSRVNSDESSIVIIMQRLAVGDISDVALELGYQHLLIPMRYEVGRSKHVVGTGDPRTVEGELMFPERFPEAQVVELEKSLGSFATAGQLQQRPNPRGGRIIRTEWLELYSIAPELEYRAIYADTALKTEERHDYSVFQCWGKGKDGKLYLLDMIRGKWEAPELERRAVAFWNKHQADQESRLRHLKVEDKASGTGLIQGLRLKAHIPVAGIQRSRDKYTRLLDVVGYIEAGMVRLPKDAPYLNDFLAECESFSAEGTHAHDDQIDPFIDAITDMLCITSAASLWARMT